MNPSTVLFLCLVSFFLFYDVRGQPNITLDLPDAGRHPIEIIVRYIGTRETHEVLTEDGYILTLFRIPRQNPKGVILFQHPVMVDSRMWLIQGNQSTAFLFWRAGYDVWLANNRGTLYSKRHAYLKPTDPEFWNHSFHEIGLFDCHANIEYVKRVTNFSKIIILGHSMGTTTSLVYASLRPQNAMESVKLFISLSPSGYFKHFYGPVRKLQPFVPIIKILTGNYSLLAHEAPYLRALRSLPMIPSFHGIYLLTHFFGGRPEDIDPKIFQTARMQFGSEMSWKIFHHYLQLIASDGEFKMYDYGPEENLKIYGNKKPSLYPIENIRTPFVLIYGSSDLISHPKDVELLYERLPKEAKIYGKLKVANYGHVSFHQGKTRIEEVYDKILQLLDNI